jgi:hypothetical protein
MRRLMAKEAAESKDRGELLEETSASDWSSADDEAIGGQQVSASNQNEPAMNDQLNIPSLTRLRQHRGRGEETGNEADMDDTSMSSRASSMMLDSINVMSMDSMNVM